MKKGQTEIIGLVVIVILLIVIGFIYLMFSLMPKQDTTVIRKNVEVSNLLNAVLRYTPGGSCGDDSINDIISDCKTYSASYKPCLGTSECQMFFNNEINDIMGNILDTRTTYKFEVIGIIIESPDGCKGKYTYTDKVIMPKYTATLNLCK